MNQIPPIFSQRLFLVFSGVLLSFMLLTHQFTLHQQTRMALNQERKHIETQLHVLGEFVAQALAKKRAEEIKPILENWAITHPHILFLGVKADGSFDWINYQRDDVPKPNQQNPLLVEIQLNKYGIQLDISLRQDVHYLRMLIKQKKWQLLLIFLFNFIFLSLALWLLLNRIALRPLNQNLQKQLDESQQLNQALEEEKSFAHVLIDAINVMIIVLDEQGKITQANKVFFKLSGYSAEEVCHLPLETLLPKIGTPLSLRVANKSASEQNMIHREVDLQCKDGSHLCVDCVCNFLLDEQKLNYTIITCIDITERKRDEKRLRQAAAVFENTAEGVVITNLQGKILKVNKAFTDTTGYTFSEVAGKTPAILQSGLQDPSFYKDMWQILQNTGRWQGEIINRRKSGETYHEWLTISSVTNENQQPINYVGVFSDISSIKKSQQQLDYLTQYNNLTGLPNRVLLNDRLNHATQRAIREQSRIAIFMMDLDRLKDINTSLGHEKGDEMLKIFAQRLKDLMRAEDTIAHLGGDEFAVMVEHIPHTDNVTWIAQKLLNLFKQEFIIDDKEIFISGSIGISLFPNDGGDGELLLQNAKTAMYEAKQNGGNNYRFYMRVMNTHSLELLLLESSLRRALEREELSVYYQPQFDLTTQTLVGMEALVRWFHPQQGMISPAEFVPLAEESNLIMEIGHWVLQTACAQTKAWHDQGFKKLKVAVNLSARQFSHQDLAKEVSDILVKTGLKAPYLKLELTESILIQEEDTVINTLQELQEIGVTLAIDDFGTGYSSLSYLKRFPISELKIDQSFVRDIEDVKQDAEIVSAIISLGQRLHLGIVAEGIENQTQVQFLNNHGCQTGQGYFFSRPLDAEKFQHFLQTHLTHT